MLEHGFDLCASHARKPFHEFVHSRSAFQVFKQCFDRNPGADEQPRAADFARTALHCDQSSMCERKPEPRSVQAVGRWATAGHVRFGLLPAAQAAHQVDNEKNEENQADAAAADGGAADVEAAAAEQKEKHNNEQ